MSILETQALASRIASWPDEAACAASAGALAWQAGSQGSGSSPAQAWSDSDGPSRAGSDGPLRDAIIELHGPLGAGKTTFVRHLLHALGVQGRVKSPTYALMEPYELGTPGDRWPAWHFDFYRFDDPQEWEDAGFRELFASRGLKLVEWPEKADGLLPVADLQLHIEPGDDEQRRVRLVASTPRGVALLA